MFESLKHWFESLDEESRLFEHPDDEVLHSALAALLYHFIALEERHSGREKREFDRLMQQEFALDQQQVDHLYQAARSSTDDLQEDLAIIDSHLKANPNVRLRFMRMLLQLVNIHGAHSDELALFYTTLHKVFPELRDIGNDADV